MTSTIKCSVVFFSGDTMPLPAAANSRIQLPLPWHFRQSVSRPAGLPPILFPHPRYFPRFPAEKPREIFRAGLYFGGFGRFRFGSVFFRYKTTSQCSLVIGHRGVGSLLIVLKIKYCIYREFLRLLIGDKAT